MSEYKTRHLHILCMGCALLAFALYTNDGPWFLLGFPGLLFAGIGFFRSPITRLSMSFLPWLLLFLMMAGRFVRLALMISH